MSPPNADAMRYVLTHLSGESVEPLPTWDEEAQARAELEAMLFGEATAQPDALSDADKEEPKLREEAGSDL
jgi:hypothetical protein